MHPAAPSRDPDHATIVAAIPARWASSRLPGKVLRRLAGRPLVEHVYRRAARAPGVTRTVVLTDDDRVAGTVADFGGEWEMTPADCASGSDRIAWAARGWEGVDAVINVQGDEPLIDPDGIGAVARHLVGGADDPIVTLAAEAPDEVLGEPHVVKVVVDARGYALYFSRAGIPYPRTPGACPARRHVGIYGYRLDALQRLAALPPSPLERAEGLEQLRALENGLPIRVLPVARAWPGVDTEEDLARVEALLAEGGRVRR